MQFSLTSAMFTFTLLMIYSAVVWDALQGMAKHILLPKVVNF